MEGPYTWQKSIWGSELSRTLPKGEGDRHALIQYLKLYLSWFYKQNCYPCFHFQETMLRAEEKCVELCHRSIPLDRKPPMWLSSVSLWHWTIRYWIREGKNELSLEHLQTVFLLSWFITIFTFRYLINKILLVHQGLSSNSFLKWVNLEHLAIFYSQKCLHTAQ